MKINTGSIVNFGCGCICEPVKPFNYNKKRDLDWIVLDTDPETTLLLSRYILDWECYDDGGCIIPIMSPVTWEECSLRRMLNGRFLDESFSASERDMIVESHLKNNDNLRCGSPGGNNTVDRVFLLSIGEVERYFDDRLYEAAAQLVILSDDEDTLEYQDEIWWLRSPGAGEAYAAMILEDGTIDYQGLEVSADEIGVRPAIRVNTKKLIEYQKSLKR